MPHDESEVTAGDGGDGEMMTQPGRAIGAAGRVVPVVLGLSLLAACARPGTDSASRRSGPPRPTVTGCPSGSPPPADSPSPGDHNPQSPPYTPAESWPVRSRMPGTIVAFDGRGLIVGTPDGRFHQVALPGHCPGPPGASPPSSQALSQLDVAGSPDGTEMAWLDMTGGPPVLVTAAAGAPPVRTTVAPDPACGTPVWSPDGRRLVVTLRTADATHPVAVVNADGTGVRVLDARGGCGPVWSADGRRLAYVDTDTDQIVTVVADGSARRVSPVRAPVLAIITEVRSVSPSGVAVVTVERPDDCGDTDILARRQILCGRPYLANLDTGALTPLVAPKVPIEDALFGADGSLVVSDTVAVGNVLNRRFVFHDAGGVVIATVTIPALPILQAYRAGSG